MPIIHGILMMKRLGYFFFQYRREILSRTIFQTRINIFKETGKSINMAMTTTIPEIKFVKRRWYLWNFSLRGVNACSQKHNG